MKRFAAIIIILLFLFSSFAQGVYATNDATESSEGGSSKTDSSIDSALPSASSTIAEPIEMTGITTPRVNAGEQMSLNTSFTAKEGFTIRSVDLTTSNDIAVFPFDIDYSTYIKHCSNETSVNYSVALRARSDASQNYYSLNLNVVYWDGSSENIQSFEIPVLLINNASNTPIPEPVSKPVKEAVPKVILTESTTTPVKVVSGEAFSLEMTFKNTSHNISVNSIKIALSAADEAFVPTSGSSTLFIDHLSPGASKTVFIDMTSKNSLMPGTYLVSAELSYDAKPDGIEPVATTETETLSIQVGQIPKIQFSKMQTTPLYNAIMGDEINVMASVYNVGKSTIYNVIVRFTSEDNVLSENEVFVGNIEQGKTGNVDTYLSAISLGQTSIKMEATYEDDDGKQYTYTETIAFYVDERAVSDIEIPVPEDTNSSFPFGILMIVLLLAVGVAILLMIKKRKKTVMDGEDRLEAEMLNAKFILDEEKNSDDK